MILYTHTYTYIYVYKIIYICTPTLTASPGSSTANPWLCLCLGPPTRAIEKKKQADRNYPANNSCHLSPLMTPWPCPFTNPTRFAHVISVHSVDSPVSKEWRSRFRHPFTRPTLPPPPSCFSPSPLLLFFLQQNKAG